MTTMDPTLKELFISEVADVLAQLEDVIEKYQVNERVAYLLVSGLSTTSQRLGLLGRWPANGT